MLLPDLRKIVSKARNPRSLSILETSENYNWEDKICLTRESEFWEVFYYERGRKIHLRSFWSESESISYFLELGKRAGCI